MSVEKLEAELRELQAESQTAQTRIDEKKKAIQVMKVDEKAMSQLTAQIEREKETLNGLKELEETLDKELTDGNS